ncbi:hypothetical protein Y032_0003g1658 [Ancylostoma ceylanicum]|uniref:Innexin n=1 Tax=Ancylostoma ceylanicum TaxID=53326 RepID=A0A016VYW9_9BILA|nr:hypothetical protein Y032_0003g1658 [Ancylostoma ceylanicum]
MCIRFALLFFIASLLLKLTLKDLNIKRILIDKIPSCKGQSRSRTQPNTQPPALAHDQCSNPHALWPFCWLVSVLVMAAVQLMMSGRWPRHLEGFFSRLLTPSSQQR